MLFISLQSPIVPSIACDGFELRLDCFPRIDKAEIADLCGKLKKPVLFTLRKSSEGGNFSGTERERLKLFEKLLALKPNYVDLEAETDPAFLKEVQEIPILLSKHNLLNTPDIDDLFSKMQSPYAYAYKIATTALSTNDALRMLLFVKQRRHQRLCGICMGAKGTLTRILGPIYGTFIDFSYTDKPSGAGQISAVDLHHIYHYSSLNQATKPYGLIGDPVKQSIGHLVHNKWLRDSKTNGVYVKAILKAEELPIFISLATELGFQGLSVTAPLKEAIVPLLSNITPYARDIGAVNTLIYGAHGWEGDNTDGLGAIEALSDHMPLLHTKMVLLGAGGAARAIAYEAKRQGAQVTIVNRTPEKAHLLAKKIGCEAGLINHDYDVIINATSHPMPIPTEFLLPNKIAMDIAITQSISPFLSAAQNKSSRLIPGMNMWLRQARRQFNLWRSVEKKILV